MMTSDNNHINTTGQQDNIVQTLPLGGGSFSTPAYFNGQIYYVASKDVIRSYVLSNGTLLPDLPGTFGTRTFGFPGATTFITANGANNGIVWAIQKASPAVLVAYNATNLSTELYNSAQAGSRDRLPGGITFAAPIAANGKVYVGSQGTLSVFGLLNSNPPTNWQPVSATYSGLFFQSNGIAVGSSGAVTITTTARGAYSGKLEFVANGYSFHGKFNSFGAGTSTISQKSSGGLTVSLQVTPDNSSISGTANNSSWSATLLANQNFTKTRNNPSPFAGTYGLSLPGPGDANPNNPQSNGAGTVKVSSSGVVNFKGALGDGTKVTETGNLSQSGEWPLFISLYHQQGEIMGWLNFNGNAISGTTTWIKEPNSKNKDFPNGFDLDSNASGSVE